MPSAPDIGVLKRRRNGWALPLNGMQVTSWIVLTFLSAGAFVSSLPLPVYPVFQILFLCAAIWIVACIIYSTSTDPGTGHKIIPKPFDRQRNAHVIERGYCNVCGINVESGTKHCRKCNKCIPLFDHHCKWLNNCIGVKNYRSFLVLVASLVVFSLSSFIFFTWSLIHFISSTSHDKPVPDSFDKDRLLFDVWNWFILTVVVVLLFAVVCASTLHLLSFHIMLFFNNQTTFSYIVKQRTKNKTIDTTDQHHSSKSLPSMSHNSAAVTDGLPGGSFRPNHVAPLNRTNELRPQSSTHIV